MKNLRKKKRERQAWWAALSPEEQIDHLKKWEQKGRSIPIGIDSDLTQQEIKQINQSMVDIGMERFIVLREEGEILY